MDVPKTASVVLIGYLAYRMWRDSRQVEVEPSTAPRDPLNVRDTTDTLRFRGRDSTPVDERYNLHGTLREVTRQTPEGDRYVTYHRVRKVKTLSR